MEIAKPGELQYFDYCRVQVAIWITFRLVWFVGLVYITPDNFPADKKDHPAPFSSGNCCSVLKSAIVDLTQRDNKRI